jgi:hypothetical protein
MGARVYDPYTGTFLQTDPVQGGGANAYGYTDGDPVNETDLTGDCFPCISVDDVVHVVTWPVREGAAVGEDVAGAAVDVGARAAGGVFGAIVEPLLFPTTLNAASCEMHNDCGTVFAERNPAQDKSLTPDDIDNLKSRGLDPHDIKQDSGTDLYKDSEGNVYEKPKNQRGAPGEHTGINLNDR